MTGTHPPRIRGFSLVELLIALAIAAILLAIALPAYGDHVRRARRVAARVALIQAAHWLERAATAGGRYPNEDAIPAGLLAIDGNHYSLGVNVDEKGTGFSLRAAPRGAQAGDRCGTLVLSHTGLREISDVPDATPVTVVTTDACWSR